MLGPRAKLAPKKPAAEYASGGAPLPKIQKLNGFRQIISVPDSFRFFQTFQRQAHGAPGRPVMALTSMWCPLEAGIRSRSRSRSWSRRSRHILVGAGAGAGAAETVCSEPEPEPEP